jgi:hypothetical protein
MRATPGRHYYFDAIHLSQDSAEFDCVVAPVLQKNWQDTSTFQIKTQLPASA